MKRVLKTLLLLFVSAGSVSAALLESDHAVFGPGSLTVDSVSQLAWLDLSHSLNYSYLQAKAAMQAGGLFEGFRHATTDEVFGLYQHAGLIALGDHPENSAALQSLIGLLGATGLDTGRPEVVGISETSDLDGARFAPMLDFYFRLSIDGSVPLYDVSLQRLALSESAAGPAMGNWLVMVVPEPSSAAVFALGLALIGLRRLKGVQN